MQPYKPATAPFNFVSLPKKTIARYKGREELPKHNIIYNEKDNIYSGTIHYTVNTKSPFMIADGKNKESSSWSNPCHFFKNADGVYTIPGSTMRGLMFSNVQILGFCNPKANIYNAKYLYRDWTSLDKRLQKHYQEEIDIKPEFGAPGKVKAGYIYKSSNDTYCIQPAKDISGKTFYHVTEKIVRSELGDAMPSSNYMYTAELLNLDKEAITKGFTKRKEKERAWHDAIKKIQNNKNFRPYYCQITFQTNQNNGVEHIVKNNSKKEPLFFNGMLLCSGFMQKKQAHYVIHDIDTEKEAISLKENDDSIRSYKEDIVKKKEKREFYFLPEEIGIQFKKPIFYAQADDKIYIGMTPYLRIMYKHSVWDGIDKTLDVDGIDYAEAMFGFTADNYKFNFSYKSRISFLDAICINQDKVKEKNTVKLALGEPKATCYPLYLEQPNQDQGQLISYADEKFAIRGYKQYWITDKIKNGATATDSVSTFLNPIEKAIFSGKISFENLSKDELGLLVFALKISDKAYQNIGMGKPYGYGKVKITDIVVSTYDMKKLYGSLELAENCLDSDKWDCDKLIKEYENYMEQQHNIVVRESEHIQEFLYMKEHVMEAEYTHYMTLQNQDGGFAKKLVLPKVLLYENVVKDSFDNPENYKFISNERNNNPKQNYVKSNKEFKRGYNTYQNNNQRKDNKKKGSKKFY